MTETHTHVRSTRWLWIAAMWVAGALFEAAQSVLFMRAIGRQHAWLIFGTELASWVPWALATPLVIGLARRYEIIRSTTVKASAVHLAAFAIISLVAEAWFAVLQVVFNPWDYPQQPTFTDIWRTSLLFQVLTYVIVYALVLTVTYVMDARERMTLQMMETARLSEELSRSQLAALRQQIEPHFMFNTLHSITGLVRDYKNDAAVSMIVGLSEFLRRASEDSHRSQVTLEEEVEYLQRYLEIQKVRFGDRLQVKVDIPVELLRAQVPNLLLQPLVENAVKHGIQYKKGKARIKIYFKSINSKLICTITDNGIGRKEAEKLKLSNGDHKSAGTSIVNERIEALNILSGSSMKSTTIDLTNESGNPVGTLVTIEIPFKYVSL